MRTDAMRWASMIGGRFYGSVYFVEKLLPSDQVCHAGFFEDVTYRAFYAGQVEFDVSAVKVFNECA